MNDETETTDRTDHVPDCSDMNDDQVTLSDAFTELRKRWIWVVLAMVLGVAATYLIGAVRSEDEWAATHRVRLVAQGSALSARGLDRTLAADRSAIGEAGYIQSSGVREFFGDDDENATILVSPAADDLTIIISAFSPTSQGALLAVDRLRDAYVERIVTADNERFADALETQCVRLSELDRIVEEGGAPPEVLLARADAAGLVASLEGLPRDGSLTYLAIGPVEGPKLIGSGGATNRQFALAGLATAALAMFVLGVRGLRSPRLRFASDVGTLSLERRVLTLPQRIAAGDLDLVIRLLKGSGASSVTVLPLRGAIATAEIESILASADLAVHSAEAASLSSIDSASAVLLVAGHRRTGRAHTRRVIHELRLVNIVPTLILISGVPASMADAIIGMPASEDV